jgi:hypothetical protein
MELLVKQLVAMSNPCYITAFASLKMADGDLFFWLKYGKL